MQIACVKDGTPRTHLFALFDGPQSIGQVIALIVLHKGHVGLPCESHLPQNGPHPLRRLTDIEKGVEVLSQALSQALIILCDANVRLPTPPHLSQRSSRHVTMTCDSFKCLVTAAGRPSSSSIWQERVKVSRLNLACLSTLSFPLMGHVLNGCNTRRQQPGALPH